MDRKTNHCVYNINYHIVFCPKYRRKIIKAKVEEAIKQIIREICERYGFCLIQMETMPDHLHIFLSAPPTVAPTEIVRKLKSITANKIFSIFPWLKKSYFWGSGLCSSTILGLLVMSAPRPSVKILKPRNHPEGGEIIEQV